MSETEETVCLVWRREDLNSACLKVLVPVKYFSFNFQDMLNESERYRDAANYQVR